MATEMEMINKTNERNYDRIFFSALSSSSSSKTRSISVVSKSFALLLILSVISSSTLFMFVDATTRASVSSSSSFFGVGAYNNNNLSKMLLQLRGGQQSTPGGGGFSFRPTPKVSPFDIRNNDKKSSTSASSSSLSSTSSTKFRNINDELQETKIEQEKQKNENIAEREETKEIVNSFLTRDSRNTFIARVYGILSVQLFFTAVVCILFGVYSPLTNIYVLNSLTGKASPLLWVPLAGVFLSTIAWFRIAISPNARQKSPNKWWWLTAFTVGQATSIGALSSLYKLKSVVTAMGATALAATTVSMYTISQSNSKYDLSQWGATLSSWAMILLVYLLLGIGQEVGWLPKGFLPYSDMMYSVFATFLFSLFLAYHTKLIVGGKHSKYRMSEKDYVFGACSLYVDIVNIFLMLLQLMGEERK